MQTTYNIPENIKHILQQNKRKDTDTFSSLIREAGYVPPHMDLFIDAITALGMGKNVLLKGPTGSGKTKLGETLSYLFQQPLFSVNCSVDLDAESLLGFKTLAYRDGKQEIDFVPGPVTDAMHHGTFLYIDEINMAKPETLPLINGVLDYRRRINNPFTNIIIKAQKGFNVIVTINDVNIGTVPFIEYIITRLVCILY